MSEAKNYMSTSAAPGTCCPDQKYRHGVCQGCGHVRTSESGTLTLEQLSELYPLEKGDIVTIETESTVFHKVKILKTPRYDGELVAEDKLGCIIRFRSYKKIKLHRD